MDKAIEIGFKRALLDAENEWRSLGCPPGTRFWQMVARMGAYDAVITLLEARDAAEGFTNLWNKKRLDLSIEAIVLKPEWSGYFSPEHLETARRRLAEVGYAAPCDQ